MSKKDKSTPKKEAAVTSEIPVAADEPIAESSKRTKPEIPEEDLLEIDVAAPTPLSKAEIRAAKKRAKEGKPPLPPVLPEKKRKRRLSDAGLDSDGDGSPGPGEERKGKGKGKTPKVKQNSIWIGNLSYRTTSESLSAWLQQGVEEMGGPEKAVTRVNLPKQKGKSGFGENKGFAYADFISPEAQALAIGLSERVLEGRKVLIKLGDDHAAKPDARTPKPIPIQGAASIPKQQHAESSTLFMGNLPFDATEELVRDHIESHASGSNQTPKVAADGAEESEGEEDSDDSEEEEEDGEDGEGEKNEVPKIGERGGEKSGLRKVRLGAFEDTGRCKGFAFLDFLTPRHATAALAMRKNYFFGGRKITLQYASAEATKRSGGGGSRPALASGGEQEKKSKYRLPRAERMAKVAQAAKTAKIAARSGSGHPPRTAEEPEEDVEVAAPVWQRQSGPLESQKEKKASRNDQRGKKWEAAGRPRPGAALAMAKREKVGIVQSAGQKVTFD